MITRPCAIALEDWLRKQGKFIGSKVDTHQNEDGSFEITKWEVDGVDQPTDSEVEDIIDNYIATKPNYNDETFKNALLADEELGSLAFQPYFSALSEALRFQNWANVKLLMNMAVLAELATQEVADAFALKLKTVCNVDLSLY